MRRHFFAPLQLLLLFFLLVIGAPAHALTAQTITFGAQGGQTYGAFTFALNPLATASSGLTVTYTSNTLSVCTISGTTVTIVTAGTCTIAANQAGDGTYSSATPVTQDIVIAKANQTITFGAQGGQNYGAAPFALNPVATASSGLPVTYTSATTSVCTINGTTVSIVAVGTCTIAANQAASTNFNAAPQVTQSIAVSQGSQTITFGAQAAKNYGATPFALSPPASASSGLALTYSTATPSVCTISGTTVTIVSVGVCTIAADQAGNANYSAAPQVTQDISINQANQTITFGVQVGKTYGAAPFALSPLASASSALAVSYSSTTLSVCTISGFTVTIVAPGACTIAANQAGNANYNAAPQVTQNITIAKASQTITFGAQGGQTLGTATFALNPLASASSGLTVTYTSNTLAVCTVSGSTITIVTSGTCTIAANQAGDTIYNAAPQVTQNIAIAKASQTITFGAQGGQVYGVAPFSLSPLASASSALAVTYTSATTSVCTISGSTVSIVTVGTCTIAANQAGDATYSAAPQVTQSFVISKANQTITFGAQVGKIYGAAPFALSPQATASSGLAVTYTSLTTSVCTITGTTVTIVSVGTCTIAANQASSTKYNAAPQVTQDIIISQASQTISFGAQAGKIFGTAPSPLSPLATASSGLAVAYSSTTTSVCTISGATVTIVSVGTCTIAANQAGNGNYIAAPQVTQNITISLANQTITFGVQSGKVYGAGPFPLSPLATASSGLAVSFTSTTLPVCTISGNTVSIVSVGTCTIAANQAGNANFNAAPQVTQNIVITKASQTITFGAQAGQTLIAPSFALNPLASASSGLAVIYTSTTLPVCTVSGATVTIVTAGTCTIAANQAGDVNYNAAPQVTQNIIIAKTNQTITFGAQAGQTLGVAPFALNPLATASSGLAISYSSTTATVCSISGATVTALAVGTCTISASQAGNGNYMAAQSVSQNIIIGSPTVPGAPTIISVIAGFGSATVSFNAPASNGGKAITVYTATCTATGQPTRTATGSGTASSIIVQGMTINVSYSCSVTASNSVGTSAASAALPVMPSETYVIPTTTSPLTGLWWNENESGWGMSVTQHGPMIFVAWYTYDPFGSPTWYVMSSCPILANACTGDIYAVTGGKSFVTPWQGSSIVETKVGVGILSFVNANTGVFNYSINGVTSLKYITRQVFTTGLVAPNPDYSDLWWNPAESGWGVSITQQYGTMFAVMFGYDFFGNPTWYYASNCVVYGNGCSGELYQASGGTMPTAIWDGTNLLETKVGIIEFVFLDGSNGIMNFFINGVPVTKLITRQSF
jgi:hypothetical protein